jgi:Tat protein translocase TatB subunit
MSGAEKFDDGLAGTRRLQIEADVDLGVAEFEEIGKFRDVGRKFSAQDIDDLAPTESRADDTVMVEDRDSVRREPDIGLEAARPEAEREGERVEGVLPSVRSCTSMGERDRWVEKRGKPLLHRVTIYVGRRLRRVFNLSGSELVFLLLLALVVLGPERLPVVIRRFGRIYGELRKMGDGFQAEFRQAIDEPMRELRETADLTRRVVDDSLKGLDEPTESDSDDVSQNRSEPDEDRPS